MYEKYMWFAVFALVFMLLDILTGLVYAFAKKVFESKVMREGLLHKASLILLIAVSVILDVANVKLELGLNVQLMPWVCTYIIFMEIMSCMENIEKAYPGILPTKLKDLLNASATAAGVEDKIENE